MRKCESCDALCTSSDKYCYQCGKILEKETKKESNQKYKLLRKLAVITIITLALTVVSPVFMLFSILEVPEIIKKKQYEIIVEKAQIINENYSKLNKNTTYDQVCELLGSKGKKANFSSEKFIWDFDFNNDNKCDIKITIWFTYDYKIRYREKMDYYKGNRNH